MSNTAAFTLSIRVGPNLSACAKWLYANAHGFLNQEWLLADPEIDSLLSAEPRLPAATRRAMLTQLVERRSHA